MNRTTASVDQKNLIEPHQQAPGNKLSILELEIPAAQTEIPHQQENQTVTEQSTKDGARDSLKAKKEYGVEETRSKKIIKLDNKQPDSKNNLKADENQVEHLPSARSLPVPTLDSAKSLRMRNDPIFRGKWMNAEQVAKLQTFRVELDALVHEWNIGDRLELMLNGFSFALPKIKVIESKDITNKVVDFELSPKDLGADGSKKIYIRIFDQAGNSSLPEIVADFYLGSGTTAVVCKELNRNFIGCDINPKSIKISNERLSATLL
jgi:hypothetical protein